MDQDQANTSAEPGVTTPQHITDADDRIAARLKKILATPGISDKDRKLVERNLKRLLEAQEGRKPKTSVPTNSAGIEHEA